MATERLTDESEAVGETASLNESLAPGSLLEDLGEVIFKLRAFMESSDGDFALGVETGMDRAADMIENAIKRHGPGD